MTIEEFFEQQKGIPVDAARNANARYTAIDICRFAKKYHESERESMIDEIINMYVPDGNPEVWLNKIRDLKSK